MAEWNLKFRVIDALSYIGLTKKKAQRINVFNELSCISLT